jgi:uncharacterized protein
LKTIASRISTNRFAIMMVAVDSRNGGFPVSKAGKPDIRQGRIRRRRGNFTMSPEDAGILDELAREVRRVVSDARIWAFGSRARGDATWESDFDVFIVVPRKDEISESKIKDVCWEVGFENDRVIASIVVDQGKFEDGPLSESTLVENILREGVAA